MTERFVEVVLAVDREIREALASGEHPGAALKAADGFTSYTSCKYVDEYQTALRVYYAVRAACRVYDLDAESVRRSLLEAQKALARDAARVKQAVAEMELVG